MDQETCGSERHWGGKMERHSGGHSIRMAYLPSYLTWASYLGILLGISVPSTGLDVNGHMFRSQKKKKKKQ